MLSEILKSKIHRATVSEADLQYEGSITISSSLLEASGIREFEKVQVVNINNGERIETYAISTDREGVICMNGAAARHFIKGDLIIIMAYTWTEDLVIKPRVVFVNDCNTITYIQ